ncbi:MAG: aspartate kinase [Candidatus Riflebacteria bacterium]|nr:aspartate kinase [Candidatus Riflebacteria bacterium]
MFKNGQVLIQKFGGSSVASVERIKNAAVRIAERAKRGYPMVVVISAMGDTTDELIALIHKISTFPDRRELDHVMATGEMVSASLMASALTELGIRAKSFNAFNLQLFSEYCGSDYCITKIGRQKEFEEFLQPASVAVVAGFQGITSEGDLTTLGRGGSDLTAVVMARELGQKVCEKYTDEDGVYTADPRIIPTAGKVWHLSYDEMLTLAHFGNGILHPRAISLAKESNIRLHVRSSFSNVEGSVIGPDGDDSVLVKSITCCKKIVYVRMNGLSSNAVDELRNLKDYPFKTVIVQFTENSVAFGFTREESFEAITYFWEKAAELNAENVECFTDLTTITLVGSGLIYDKALADSILSQSEKCGGIIKQHDGLRISMAIPKDQISKALTLLHGAFLL